MKDMLQDNFKSPTKLTKRTNGKYKELTITDFDLESTQDFELSLLPLSQSSSESGSRPSPNKLRTSLDTNNSPRKVYDDDTLLIKPAAKRNEVTIRSPPKQLGGSDDTKGILSPKKRSFSYGDLGKLDVDENEQKVDDKSMDVLFAHKNRFTLWNTVKEEMLGDYEPEEDISTKRETVYNFVRVPIHLERVCTFQAPYRQMLTSYASSYSWAFSYVVIHSYFYLHLCQYDSVLRWEGLYFVTLLQGNLKCNGNSLLIIIASN